MPESRIEARLRAFAVLPEFDSSDGDAELFARLARGGHVFCAGEAGQGWAMAAVRVVKTKREDGHG
jgi:hypothetical protein